MKTLFQVKQIIKDELTKQQQFHTTYEGLHRVNIFTERIEAKIDCLSSLLKRIK